jgi:hypothetical protein
VGSPPDDPTDQIDFSCAEGKEPFGMAVISFQVCDCCGTIWPTRDAFLSDGNLRVDGYKPNFQTLEEGLFFITHDRDECGATLAIAARNFLGLYGGPRYTERKTFSDECSRYCLDPEKLDRCAALCECAFVREVLQIIGNRLETARTASSHPQIKDLEEPPHRT